MSTRTTKLNLVNNTGSDPFSLDDFSTNWNILDSEPGVYVCTSTTRPTWGPNQAGRTIVETDTFRLLVWNGGNWQEPLTAPGVWMFESAPQLALAANVSTSWTLGSISVKRPCQIVTITSVVASKLAAQSVSLASSGRIDGTGSNISGAGTGGIQWPSATVVSNSWSDLRSATFFGYRRVNPGTHTLGVASSVSTSTGSGTTGLTVRALSILAIVTAPSGGMSLV